MEADELMKESIAPDLRNNNVVGCHCEFWTELAVYAIGTKESQTQVVCDQAGGNQNMNWAIFIVDFGVITTSNESCDFLDTAAGKRFLQKKEQKRHHSP